MVLADRSGSGWAYCLHSLIDSQFDVDRLDYLLRDAANAGTEYGGIDTTRLLQSLELHRPGATTGGSASARAPCPRSRRC